MHDILRRFFEQHRREPLTISIATALQKELRDLADRVFDEHERVVPPLNKQIWKIDREIRKILLDQVLLYELEIQEQSANAGVVPAYFEVAFGVCSPSRAMTLIQTLNRWADPLNFRRRRDDQNQRANRSSGYSDRSRR